MQTTYQPLRRLLVVEDEYVIANDLRKTLHGHLPHAHITLAKAVPEAVRAVEQNPPDLVLIDIRLHGEQSGIELGELLRTRYRIPFVYVTSHADKHTLQQAVATQPYGYIVKPFEDEEIVAALDAAWMRFASEQLARQQVYLTEELRAAHHLDNFVAQDPAMQAAWQLVQQVAPVDMTTLLLGETGTGKELFARALHAHSPRQAQPLVKVNCAALPAQLIESELFGHEKGAFTGASARRIGKFELAHQGTLFLDEVGELPLELQPKLLRVLQEKEIERVGSNTTLPVDVRIIAATNRDLPAEVAAGRFRADLYYRLSVFPITIPPLRERPADITALADFFLARSSKQLGKPLTGFSAAARREMQQYAWPGNVRELQHVVERAALLSTTPVLATLGLPAALAPAAPAAPAASAAAGAPRPLQDVERDAILAALAFCNGRVRGAGGAAEYLRIPANTLDGRMRKLGIKKGFDASPAP
ncbi:sigma-54-dependent transcriptional regulator [Hymenobacter weizhouensis]|uniref:sigma-54-dependent transcriptional regulator n=1 Tax=Hymenobacter sp. YIM 151500-1 TaxID=2987689 RepID=UPI002227DEE0|nr:sigma-54 dependent transcriptional regulator [Hymenobacter sp. YIM 151500-1]UYZ62498.1 sigma-54 dependent transcriptional regulator [Hymenobacter sp. YIM 151500-1]